MWYQRGNSFKKENISAKSTVYYAFLFSVVVFFTVFRIFVYLNVTLSDCFFNRIGIHLVFKLYSLCAVPQFKNHPHTHARTLSLARSFTSSYFFPFAQYDVRLNAIVPFSNGTEKWYIICVYHLMNIIMWCVHFWKCFQTKTNRITKYLYRANKAHHFSNKRFFTGINCT